MAMQSTSYCLGSKITWEYVTEPGSLMQHKTKFLNSSHRNSAKCIKFCCHWQAINGNQMTFKVNSSTMVIPPGLQFPRHLTLGWCLETSFYIDMSSLNMHTKKSRTVTTSRLSVAKTVKGFEVFTVFKISW